jgi:hypothetical protein
MNWNSTWATSERLTGLDRGTQLLVVRGALPDIDQVDLDLRVLGGEQLDRLRCPEPRSERQVVSVSSALSMSVCGTVEAEPCAVPGWLPPPPHAASSQALEAAAAEEMRNLRLVNAEDIAVLS